ncbi:MAG: transglycosylase domain-containing protein [Fimbriimonadaceae bacterium]
MAASQAGSQRRVRAARRRGQRPWKRTFKIFGLSSVILLSLTSLVAYGVWMHFLNEAETLMPGIESKLQALKVPPSQILTADGKVLYQVSAEFRESVPISAVPQRVRDAMVEAEDRRFYEHHGVDLFGIARAVTFGAKEGKVSQGASTITMQLAKRLHSLGEKTYQRKLMDMAIAEKMEDEWSKDHILELYLNQVYFGSGAYGIEAASEVYFGKKVGELTLGEAAMLARCVRRPGDETPFLNYDKAEFNRNVVLKSMLDDQKITQAQYDQASNEDDKKRLAPEHHDFNGRVDLAPYVVTAALKELHEQYPAIHLADGGYRVYTNIDWDMQRATERAVHRVVQQNARAGVNNAAFVLMDGQGRITSLVGGANFRKNQFNTITQGHRQPGSSFKPIVYATAFALGKLDLDSTISNARLDYVDPSTGRLWQPRNDNGRYGGSVSVRSAVAWSINVAAARTALDVGIGNVVSFAKDVFGFESELPEYPALALGACDVSPLEMAQAYSVFMLRGNRATPFLIDKIESADGSLVGSSDPVIAHNVLNPAVCDDIDTLLRGVVTNGTGTRAGVVPNARGKTGTTSSNKDAWFCGYANGLIGIGWVGNEQYSRALKAYVPRPMSRSAFGGTVTAPFWADVEGAAYAKFHDRYAGGVNSPPTDRRDAQAPKAAAVDPATIDPALPVDPKAPTPDGSPDQKNLPQTSDPTAVVSGPGHGASLNPEADLPPPPPDPTLAQPEPLRHAPAPVRASPRPAIHRAPKEVQYVEVEICADSGELATDYCPETVTRRFVKGQQPKKKCHIHHG